MITRNGESAGLQGKSTDQKPTTADVNELFLELDTGKFYYFDTDETWKEVGAGA